MSRRLSNLDDFGQVFEPQEADEPILARPVRNALLEWLTEVWAEEELKEVGIGPRRRALFDGAPGVGKTTLAHHLAARLGLRMLAVRPERLISKYVGETGERIGQMFDLAADKDDPIVLFLDEFDAYSRQRRRSTQSADDSRNEEVNTLLQRIEQHTGFLIALIRQFCENLKRQLIVGPKLNLDMRRETLIGRLLESVKPHPDLGKPRLWAEGEKDRAIKTIPWPLPKAADVVEEADLNAVDAEELGRQAARDRRPILDNPFPFGDARRARFDEGFRKESESDGMGGEVVSLKGRRP